MFKLIKAFWKWFRSPSKMAVGTLILLSALGGILFWGGFIYILAHILN